MSTNERRRRPQLRVESGKTGRFTAVLSPSPSALPWIAFAFAAISGLLVALTVDGGDRPFPYVLGQRVDRDLRLREPLRIPNETATRQRREEAAAAAPIAYRLDPQPTLALLERLKVLIGAVAATSEFGGVDPKIRAEWELTHDAFANLREIGRASCRERVSLNV